MLLAALSRRVGLSPSRQSLIKHSLISLQTRRNMRIESIPMWTGSSDNYSYLVIDDATKDAMIIDPANPPEVLPVLQKHISSGSINFKGIINTHHHWDHAGGNAGVLEKFHGLPVIGGAKVDKKTTTPNHGDTFKIGANITVKALHTPCHTQDSICYYMQDGEDRAVFTGDTLFIAGCGRFFEGTAAEMHKALNGVLGALPDDTKVFDGHNYTKSNARFGLSILDVAPIKGLLAYVEKHGEAQGKFTIGDEKKHNVFMMVEDPRVQEATGERDPVEVMAALRELKNNFR